MVTHLPFFLFSFLCGSWRIWMCVEWWCVPLIVSFRLHKISHTSLWLTQSNIYHTQFNSSEFTKLKLNWTLIYILLAINYFCSKGYQNICFYKVSIIPTHNTLFYTNKRTRIRTMRTISWILEKFARFHAFISLTEFKHKYCPF